MIWIEIAEKSWKGGNISSSKKVASSSHFIGRVCLLPNLNVYACELFLYPLRVFACFCVGLAFILSSIMKFYIIWIIISLFELFEQNSRSNLPCSKRVEIDEISKYPNVDQNLSCEKLWIRKNALRKH